MGNITAKLVKDLRDKTGAGMMDCKKALNETEGYQSYKFIGYGDAYATLNSLEHLCPIEIAATAMSRPFQTATSDQL